MMHFNIRICLLVALCAVVSGNRFPGHKYNNNYYVAAASQQVPQQVQGGYKYPAPVVGSANAPRPQSVPYPTANSAPASLRPVDPQLIQQQQASAVSSSQQPQPTVTTSSSSSSVSTASGDKLLTAADTRAESERQLHAHHSAQLQKVDVACGKERMTVRVTFDQAFNGIIYAKGHYNDPNCRFVNANAGQRMFQFDMTVGSCGVAFIDSGLTTGGQAYVEGLLVIILEQGVQEAWDAARRLRCLWEGNIDQTVTFPLSVNMLDSQTLTFSGDTASASLEIQTGRGPRAPAVQGLVRIGDLLTAVVTVVGDADFDLLVRNCVATDGTPNNRVVLSDNRGCATKPKLMGGWLKQRNPGNVLAYSYLSAFKFPDLMDLFLECTVSLCKGACEECPKEEYHELHVQNHGSDDQTTGSGNIDVRLSTRAKRSANNSTLLPGPEDSLRLRRVVHVVSPDDFPEFVSAPSSNTVYGGSGSDCFSLITLMAAVFIALLLVLTAAVVINIFRRSSANRAMENPMKFYGSAHRP